MKKLLEISHLKKSFGDTEVLKDISMEVNEGEVVAILGPSGSGKSTLLRCSTLLETMDAGTLKLGGETACEDKDGASVYVGKKELREIKNTYGLVFQNFNLFPHYTVMKNVTDAPVSVQKRDKNEVEKEAKELLKKVGLDGKENSYPCQLSGGQQQRVAIARALAMNPEMLFFDEPRARNEAAPINAQRFGIDTPCSKNGTCFDCKSPQCICCQILTTRFSRVKGRFQIILVDENLGF